MYTKMNGMWLLVRCCSVEGELSGNRHDSYAAATPNDGRVVGHMPQKIPPVCSIRSAQSLFGVVALSHVQLVTVDVILQT